MNTPLFLNSEGLPFCKGCGHSLVAQSVQKALANIPKLTPRDVILVSDIGCIGMIDQVSETHTIHGLHGRSAALGAGVSLGLANPRKKVLVFLGDGGATIGLQHLLDAAQRNLDLKVLVHNNMLYGMTGGQPSGLSPKGFKTPIIPTGQAAGGFDLCKLFHNVGATYAQRLLARGDFSQDLVRAFSTKGFAFVEAMELCPSYGVKFNPDQKPLDIARESGIELVIYTNPEHPVSPFVCRNLHPKPLFDEVPPIPVSHPAGDGKRFGIILSGTAGEGIQRAAEFLAEAGMACGLNVTKKGSYPVTVGVGFSTAEILICSHDIHYTGNENPGVVVVTSEDGWKRVRGIIGKLSKEGIVLMDSSIKDRPTTEAQLLVTDLRTPMGARNCSLFALFYLLKHRNLIPPEALLARVRNSKLGKKIDLQLMLEKATS
jgi:pyruvate/2-oxoacid:ferredoxin oxidoreductase beta subunit